MLLNEDHMSNTTSGITPTTFCDKCGIDDSGLLHNVRNEGSFRHLCTSCLLRLHPQSFCPTCFTVYHLNSPPNNADVTCNTCSSVSHSSCVHLTCSNYPYTCPLCVNPNSPIFVLKDFGNIRILAAAASISSFLMTKAAEAAKYEAERRVREAIYTRKRAKYALENMEVVVAKEKMKRNNKGSVIEVGMPWFGGNAGFVMERRDSYNHNSVGNGGGGVGYLERNPIVGNLEILERSSNGVLEGEVNSVECMEKGSSE